LFQIPLEFTLKIQAFSEPCWWIAGFFTDLYEQTVTPAFKPATAPGLFEGPLSLADEALLRNREDRTVCTERRRPFKFDSPENIPEM
jgi:hypothetical protein